MKLIINADDFGASSLVNKAIIEAFNEKLISSATIMVNTPSFDEACNLINKFNLHGKIGLHINLTEGSPLTERITYIERFCDITSKKFKPFGNIFCINRKERRAIKEEVLAQYEKLISNGITPTHFDSHHHSHTKWAVAKHVIKLAKAKGIKGIRLTRNCGTKGSFLKRIYKKFYNFKLKKNSLAFTDFFGSDADLLSLKRGTSKIEMLVHPGYSSEGVLIDLPTQQDLRTLILKVKSHFNVDTLSNFFNII